MPHKVEIFFGIITRRGSFTSIKDLIVAIETLIEGWNDHGRPFTWTRTTDAGLVDEHRVAGPRTPPN